MLRRGARSLLAAAEHRPQLFAIGTSAPTVVAGDVVAQQVERRFDGEPGGIDGPRCLSILGWSVWYLGFVQYRIYLHIVDPVITVERFGRTLTPLVKSVSCNAVVTPFINIPLYYLWSTTRLPFSQWDIGESIKALRREWVTSSMSGIALWGPAQWFQFALVPTPLRIPFMSGVAFVWSLVISLQAQYGNVRPAKGFH